MSSRSWRLCSQATFQAGSSSSHRSESGFHALSFFAQFWVYSHLHALCLHTHAHTLIPMCISTPSHNSHTHLYMLMHTRAYTYSFTHMYIHVHAWPHNSSFHGAPYLSRSWGQGKRSALFIRKASRDCSPFSTLSMYLKVLLLNGFLQLHFITAATNIMSTYYIQNVCKGATFGRRLREKRFAPQPRSQNPRHISGAVNSTCFCSGRWQQLYLPNLGFANMHCRWSR